MRHVKQRTCRAHVWAGAALTQCTQGRRLLRGSCRACHVPRMCCTHRAPHAAVAMAMATPYIGACCITDGAPPLLQAAPHRTRSHRITETNTLTLAGTNLLNSIQQASMACRLQTIQEEQCVAQGHDKRPARSMPCAPHFY